MAKTKIMKEGWGADGAVEETAHRARHVRRRGPLGLSKNPKAFAVATNGTNRILFAAPKAAKAGGLYHALGSAAVKPTDAVDAKKEYTLLAVSGSQDGGGDVTLVTPEVGDMN